MADRVNVVTPAQQVVSVPAEQVQDAISEGYSLATPEQAAAAKRARERGVLGEVASGAAAASAGFARGATFGLSDVGATYLPGGLGVAGMLAGAQTIEERRALLKQLSEEHPYASGAGEIAGSIYGLGKAKAVLGAIPGVSRLATPTGRLGRWAISTATGAAEGAAIGAQQAISESVLEDTDLTGERLWQSVGHGAMFGGATAGLLSGAGHLSGAALGKLRGRAVAAPGAEGFAAVAKGAFGEEAPGLGQRIATAVSKQQADVGTILGLGEKEAIEGLYSSRRARKLAYDGASQLDDYARAYTGGLNEVLTAQDPVMGLVRKVPLKHSKVVGLVGDVDAMEAARGYEKIASRVESSLDEMMVANRDAYHLSGGKQLKKGVALIKRETADAIAASKTDAERKAWLFIGGDRLKREWGAYTDAASALARNKPTVTRQKTAALMQDVYEDARVALEDSAVWGTAGATQKAINAPLSANIAAGGVFHKGLTTQGVHRSLSDPWRMATVADPAKVDAFVKGLTTPSKDLVNLAQREWLTNLESSVDAMAKVYSLSPEQAAGVAKLKAAAAQMRRTVADSEETIMRVNQARSLDEASRAGDLGLLAKLPFMSPARNLRHLAAAETFAERAKAKMGTRVDGLMATAVQRGRAAAQAGPEVGRTAAVVGAARAGAGDYDAGSARVRTLADNRPAVAREIESGLGELAYGAPRTVRSATATGNRALEHLLSTMPSPGLSRYPLAMAPAMRPPKSEMDAWLSRARALQDPSSILEDATHGTSHPAAIDAVRQVMPATYADMQRQLRDKLLDLSAEGKSLPYPQLLAASRLLDEPLDPTQDPALAQAIAAGYDAGEQPGDEGAQKPAGKAPDLARFYRTGLDRAEDQEY